jgi:hypothetical protein
MMENCDLYWRIGTKRTIRIVLGSFLLLLGLVGLFLPILQGWLFMAMGVMTLSRDITFFARMENRITDRYPNIGRRMERIRAKLPIF